MFQSLFAKLGGVHIMSMQDDAHHLRVGPNRVSTRGFDFADPDQQRLIHPEKKRWCLEFIEYL